MPSVNQSAHQSPSANVKGAQKRRVTHTRSCSVENIDLNKPGRLRVGHLLTLFSISHSSLYARIKLGSFPAADGHDGSRPYWRTSSIRTLLE